MTTQFSSAPDNDDAPVEPRSLRCLGIDLLRVGVFEDQVVAVVEWNEPTPLPFSPDSVLGIVSVEGRMFTVLDIAGLLGANGGAPRALILALRGEEQFALAVDVVETPIELDSTTVFAATETSAPRLIRDVVHHGEQQVQMLDVGELFAGVIQGRERRRRRF